MSEGKFSCPHCGQHIAGDQGYIGRQITCPACQGQFVVPPFAVAPSPAAPSGGSRLSTATTSSPSYPPSPVAAAPTPPARDQKNTLAVVSLCLSLASLLIWPLGYIPGIICGHLAKAKIRRNPALGGGGMAKAGLIVGYVFLLLNVLAVVAFILLGRAVVAQAQEQMLRARTNATQTVPARPSK